MRDKAEIIPKLAGLKKCLSPVFKINLLLIAVAAAKTIVVQWSARSSKLSPKAVIKELRKLNVNLLSFAVVVNNDQ